MVSEHKEEGKLETEIYDLKLHLQHLAQLLRTGRLRQVGLHVTLFRLPAGNPSSSNAPHHPPRRSRRDPGRMKRRERGQRLWCGCGVLHYALVKKCFIRILEQQINSPNSSQVMYCSRRNLYLAALLMAPKSLTLSVIKIRDLHRRTGWHRPSSCWCCVYCKLHNFSTRTHIPKSMTICPFKQWRCGGVDTYVGDEKKSEKKKTKQIGNE